MTEVDDGSEFKLRISRSSCEKTSKEDSKIHNIFPELRSRLRMTYSYLNDIHKHSYVENTDKKEKTEYDIMDSQAMLESIKWCMETVRKMETFTSIKELLSEKEDVDFLNLLDEFAKAKETNVAVARHLSINYVRPASERRHSIPEHFHFVQLPKNLNTGRVKMYVDTTPDDVVSTLSLEEKNEETTETMNMLDTWTCDIFRVHNLFKKTLSNVMFFIMTKHNLFEIFGIPNTILVKYMFEVEKAYQEVSYHDSIHAADVLQTTHYLISAEPLSQFFSDLEVFALLFSAAIHDVDHPGVTNNYMVKTRAPLATLYNDTSVLENHHIATAFKILYDQKENFLDFLSSENVKTFRMLVIANVMATDMTLHVPTMSGLNFSSEKLLNDKPDPAMTLDDRMSMMKGLIHFADISNPAKPLEIYKQWVNRITDEFFKQGDLERSKNLEISPMCDRFTANVGKCQMGFIDYIVRPICDIVAKIIGHENCERGIEMQEHLRENYIYFEGLAAESEIVKDEKEYKKNAIARLQKYNQTHNITYNTPMFFKVDKLEGVIWDAPNSDDNFYGIMC